MTELKLILEDAEQRARLQAIEDALKALTVLVQLSTVTGPHVDWTIGPITEQEIPHG